VALDAERDEQGRKVHSQRAIAGALGVNQSTVARDLRRGEASASPEHVAGLDGKSYPATRPEPKEKAVGRSDELYSSPVSSTFSNLGTGPPVRSAIQRANAAG
jgi:DNA-binding transcriptional MocR family regulator